VYGSEQIFPFLQFSGGEIDIGRRSGWVDGTGLGVGLGLVICEASVECSRFFVTEAD
jgi:hypothetical protein